MHYSFSFVVHNITSSKQDIFFQVNTNVTIFIFCEAPTLQLKALNKHTHIMYIEMEMLSKKFKLFIILTSVQA